MLGSTRRGILSSAGRAQEGSLGKMKSKQRPRGHAEAWPREETVGQMRGRGTHRWKGTHVEVQGRHNAALGKAECDRDGGEEEPGCESLISEETIQFILQTWTCSE